MGESADGSADAALRARLSRLDPAGPAVPVDPVTSPRAADLMERAMHSPDVQNTDLEPAVDLAAERRRRRPAVWLAAAVAAAAAGIVRGVVVHGGGSDPAGTPDRATTLALTLPDSSAVAGSCMQFDVAFLRDMPVAFAGTATEVGAEQVTLDVDRWYRGGDADRVALAVPGAQTSAALDGVDFREGERYLVTATDGTVKGCGYSGPASPELERAFAEAFGG
jgi:hypothetical protein